MKEFKIKEEKFVFWKSILMFFLLIPLFTACKKEPINRNIEGHWKLEQFTILGTNEEIHCERIFWGITRFGAKMFEKQGPNGYEALDAKMEYRDNETVLVLKDIVLEYDNSIKPTLNQLLPYGLNNANETIFQVVESKHKAMILQSDYARLMFKKF